MEAFETSMPMCLLKSCKKVVEVLCVPFVTSHRAVDHAGAVTERAESYHLGGNIDLRGALL